MNEWKWISSISCHSVMHSIINTIFWNLSVIGKLTVNTYSSHITLHTQYSQIWSLWLSVLLLLWKHLWWSYCPQHKSNDKLLSLSKSFITGQGCGGSGAFLQEDWVWCWEYNLAGMPVQGRAPCTQTFTVSFIPRQRVLKLQIDSNLSSASNWSPCCNATHYHTSEILAIINHID